MLVFYTILDDFVIRIPYSSVGAEPDDLIHDVCVYEKVFKVGVFFPFLLEVRELLLEVKAGP